MPCNGSLALQGVKLNLKRGLMSKRNISFEETAFFFFLIGIHPMQG